MHSVISYRPIDTIFYIWYDREYYLMNEIKCWHENSKKKLLVSNIFFNCHLLASNLLKKKEVDPAIIGDLGTNTIFVLEKNGGRRIICKP